MPDTTARTPGTDTTTFFPADSMPAAAAPLEEAFSGGETYLEQDARDTLQARTGRDSIPDRITGLLTVICIFTMLLSLKKLVNIIPSLLGCAVRWKEAFNLEYNMKLSRDRDIVFFILLLPFCLVVTKFGIYSPDFMAPLDAFMRLAVFAGIFTVYLLLRRTLGFIFRSADIDRKAYSAAQKLFLTFFNLTVLCSLAIAGTLSYTNLETDTIRAILCYVFLFFYIVFIIRKSQIFSHYCSVFSTILYLCTLEILPTGLLIVPAMFL